jgi:UPF0755 protein
VALAVYRQLDHFFFSPANPAQTAVEIFEVPENANFKRVAKDLETRGFVRNYWAIALFAKIKQQEGAIKAGEYELAPSMLPSEILERLISGKSVQRKITLKEGETMAVLAPALAQQGIISSQAAFESTLRSPELLQALGVEGSSMEGYLFPETYQFPRNTPPEKIVRMMYEQLQKRWEPEWDLRLAQLKMTRHQILTLASIIERESGTVSEQPLIASVFHNRLAKGMRLQADPTVIYGVPDFDGNITKEHLLTPTPYNTYVITGLPPGPIGSPGISAIKAALYPAITDFLYFVANGNGAHVFSETLEDHNSSVGKYQLNK